MQTNAIATWSVRAVTLGLAALAALSGAYWALKSTHGHSVPSAAALQTAGMPPPDAKAVAHALSGGNAGAVAGAPVASQSNYVLLGVIAVGTQAGAALISVDGKPAKPFLVGATVDANLVLQSVGPRRATLSQGRDGPVQVALELPPLSH